MSQVTYLEITSWIGMSPEAVHYYGSLKNDDERVDLTRTLTRRDVSELRKTIRRQYPGAFELYASGIEVGSKYTGFDTHAELIDLAKSTYRNHFPDSSILLVGRSSVCDPQKMVDGPADLMTAANKIYEEFESFEGYQYRRNYLRAKALNDRWDELFKEKK